MVNLYPISSDPRWNYCFNLLLDDSVSEVEANGPEHFFIKRNGRRIHLTDIKFANDEEYTKSIEHGVVPHIATHESYDPHGYIFEGPLRYKVADKEIRGRCHIVLSPAADTPQVTIAKKSTALATLDAIAAKGSMASEMLTFVKASIAADLTTVLSGGTGAGKALHKDTLIPTPGGFVPMGKLRVGDTVFDETGARTTITRKYCPLDPKSYRLSFSNGETIKASAGHLWQVTHKRSSRVMVLSTEELLRNGFKNFFLNNLSGPVDYPEAQLPVDPYILGKFIGQTQKSIPGQYLRSSVAQRMALLSGIMEKLGHSGNNGLFKLRASEETLANNLRELVLSLGWQASRVTYGFKRGQDTYSLSFVPELRELKLGGKTQQIKHKRIYVTAIEEIKDNPEDYFCIAVDSPSHLFLAGETFVPTHNTTFLEAMCKYIPLETRIGVAEDTPELSLPHPNATYLHSVPWRPGMDEKDVATLSWVVAQFNRMRTDKLIIGETRGKEFADFLVAANSGMEGSLTTIHANEPTRALDKMTNFAIKGSPGTPVRSVNTDIATSIDLIFQLAYYKTDSRYRMTAIQEITSTLGTGEDASITTQPLYRYDSSKDTWVKVGHMTDNLRRRFEDRNIDIINLLKSSPGETLYAPGATQGGPVQGGLPTTVRRV